MKTREIFVYVPAGGHPATQGIARGSAILGRPVPGAEEVQIHYEGAIFDQSEMRTLADRAVYACGCLLDDYPTTATRLVPRDALVAVGSFHPATGEVLLTGQTSASAVATWLGVPVLDPAELRRGRLPTVSAGELAARLAPGVEVAVNAGLAAALIRRGGLRREGGEWLAPDGRRTSARAEALIWALTLIAAEG
jgi:hypothetical protein